MEVEWFLMCNGILTLMVVVSFLCAQWLIFNGTPIQWIHHFNLYAAYDYFLRFVGFVFASKGLDLILSLRISVVIDLTLYCKIENSFRSLAPRVLQWILSTYNTQILLMVFLALVSLLLAGFFGYNLNLCLNNTTTNEKIKWREYMSLEKKISEAKESAAALKAGMTNVELKGPAERQWKGLWRRSEAKVKDIITHRNLYDKGKFGNISEIVYPISSRQSFWKTYHKSE